MGRYLQEKGPVSAGRRAGICRKMGSFDRQTVSYSSALAVLKLYKTIIKGNIGQNVNIYVDFSKLDNFLITIITYLFSFFTLLFFTSLTFKTLPLEEARTNTKWCWIHYFLFTSFEKMGFGVSILFFKKAVSFIAETCFYFL